MGLSIYAGGFLAKSVAEFVEGNDIWHPSEDGDD